MNMNSRFPLFALGLLCAFVPVSCEVLEEDLSADRVRIVGPAEGAEVRAGAVTFRWEAVEGASGYDLAVASPTFAGGYLAADTTLYADTLGSRRYGCRVVLGAGEYEWSVAAFNSGYATRPEVRRLTVLPVEETPGGGEERPDAAPAASPERMLP